MHITDMYEAYVTHVDDEYADNYDYDDDTDDDTDTEIEDDTDDNVHTDSIEFFYEIADCYFFRLSQLSSL